MKYILLLIFFTTADGKQYLLQTSNTSEYESRDACKLAAESVWASFKPLGTQNAMKVAAWCLAKDAKLATDNFRIDTVGK